MSKIDGVIDYLITAEIYTYRLSNGDIIIAEEVFNEDGNKSLVYTPAVMLMLEDDDTTLLAPWDLYPNDNLVEINHNNVISKVESTMSLKAHYFNFILSNVNTTTSEDDIDEAYSILEEFLSIDESESPKPDYSKRWNWNPELN